MIFVCAKVIFKLKKVKTENVENLMNKYGVRIFIVFKTKVI